MPRIRNEILLSENRMRILHDIMRWTHKKISKRPLVRGIAHRGMNKALPNWTEEQKRLSACLGGIKKGNYFVISSEQTLDFYVYQTGHSYAACALADYSSYGYFCPVSSGSLNSLISLRMSVSLCLSVCLSVCLSLSPPPPSLSLHARVLLGCCFI